MPGRPGIFFDALQVVATFVVQRKVEADSFFFFSNAQAHDRVDYFQNNEGRDRRVDDREAYAFALDPDLSSDVGHSAEAAHGRCCEHTCQDRAEDTADAVYAESVQGVVVAQFAFQGGGAEEADHASSQTDDQRAHWAHSTGSRGNGNQTGNHTRSDARHLAYRV